jgi:glycine/D-amino acid oxidase-like deaminating enzyme
MITEYVKGNPYFTEAEDKLKPHLYQSEDISTDTLIVGGGINGAVCAYYFSKNGIDCALIDKGRIGHCSTSAATALLEYQLDDFADELTQYYSKAEVAGIYRVGCKSLDDIATIIGEVGNGCHYSAKDTIIYTLDKSDKKALRREFDFRKANGFDVKLYEHGVEEFSFPIEAGLYSFGGGAEFNPYLFTKQLVEYAEEKGAQVFEHTEAKEIKKTDSGFVVTTSYGCKINCNHIVCATGYNTKLFTSKKLCTKYISYSIVTNPLEDLHWTGDCLLQDTEQPYHYIRLLHDSRLIAGGGDKLFFGDTIKIKTAQKKYCELVDYLKKLFPRYAERINAEYKFAGAFSATDNNVAVIGEMPEEKNVWYCLGYGANGIIYSVYGAQMLVERHKNENYPFDRFFSPARKLP